jgi:hypothetical protein
VVAADSDCLLEIVGVSRADDADRELAVVGRIGGVEGAVAGLELDLAAEMGAQVGSQRVSHRKKGSGAATRSRAGNGALVFHGLRIPVQTTGTAGGLADFGRFLCYDRRLHGVDREE